MREIEFRGKRVIDDTWIYGGYIKTHRINKSLIGGTSRFCQVKPETVGQYTGLKDKNGTKIFEGDIVEVSTFEDDLEGYSPFVIGKFKGEVFFDEFKSQFQIVQKIYIEEDNSYEYEQHDLLYGTDEVIGNIYDNPELLN